MFIKIAFFCASLLAVTATAPVGIALHNTGISSTSKQQDSHGNYAFSYDIVDEHGASNSRSEAGDAFGNKKGSYTLHDTDGRARVVDYIADEHGFRAVVNTNEPGTAQSYPAGAIINSPYDEPAAPDAAPVSIVHEVPVSISAHVAPVSHPIKSVVSHATPVAVAHTVPATYSTKSIISHDAPVALAQTVAVPYDHSTHLAYSPKSLVSHATSPIAVAHASPVAITRPVSYSSKSVIANPVPITKHYATSPSIVHNYKSIFDGGLRIGDFGYSHGLLGPRFGGHSYNAYAAPPVSFDHAAPGPVSVAHTIPSTYSTKSVISHDVPVALTQAVAVPHAHSTGLAYSPKSVVSHSTSPIAIAHSAPLAYSTKSIVSHAAPIKTFGHAAPVAITSPGSYSSKTVIANPVPVAKNYVTSPSIIGNYKSFFNGGLRLGDFGYSHGLLGPRFGGHSYNTKLYNYGLQGHGLEGPLYDNLYGHGYHGNGYGILRPYMDGHSYGKGAYDYNGLKSYYY